MFTIECSCSCCCSLRPLFSPDQPTGVWLNDRSLYHCVDVHNSMWLLVLLLATTTVLSRPTYQHRIPNGENVPNYPAVGHNKPDSGYFGVNQFGRDFRLANLQWTKEFCNKDSDGDGRTNGQELGDARCVWRIGLNPERVVDITNPGVHQVFTNTLPPVAESPSESPVVIDMSNAPTMTVRPTENNEQDEGALVIQGWVVAHAVFMAVSFGAIIPFSSLIPFVWKSYRPTMWRNDHIVLMSVAAVLGVIGFFIAIAGTGFYGSAHGWVGIVILVLVLLQSLGGFVRFRITNRLLWKSAHALMGQSILILNIGQIAMGYALLGRFPTTYQLVLAFALIHVFGLVVLYVVMRRYIWKRNQVSTSGATGGDEYQNVLDEATEIPTTFGSAAGYAAPGNLGKATTYI